MGDPFEEVDRLSGRMRATAVCTSSMAPEGPITQNGQK